MNATNTSVDIFIIGGGINGAAVARDAIGRGFSVMLAEAEDYASATSSSSSKLIHGGLRYLETYEFSLVRESLHERETMLKIAPHICFPLRFLVPITRTQRRPAWIVRIGLMLYDFLSGAKLLARSGALSKAEVAALPRLRKKDLTAVLHYPDCWIDDARLVLSTLVDARRRGADILNYRRVEKITPIEDGYSIELDERGSKRNVHARYVVNAAGPWANEVLDVTEAPFPRSGLRLVRGSHIVLKMPEPAENVAYTLQSRDGRVIFTLPWLNSRYLIIGTTDAPQKENPRQAKCSDEERDYLLKSYNRYFAHPGGAATSADVVWTWAGVRPLIDDGEDNPSKVTREPRLAVQKNGAGAFVTIYGGKLTTHRTLGEKSWRSWPQRVPTKALRGPQPNRSMAVVLAGRHCKGWLMRGLKLLTGISVNAGSLPMGMRPRHCMMPLCRTEKQARSSLREFYVQNCNIASIVKMF